MNRESELLFVVRHVAAQLLKQESGFSAHLGDSLENGDITAIENLNELIKKAKDEWTKRYHAISISDAEMYWYVNSSLEQSEHDGPIVVLKWGVDDRYAIKMIAEDAFDLAVEIIEFFTDENGIPNRPERPVQPEPDRSPELTRYFKEYAEVSGELMKKEKFKGMVSAWDVKSWIMSGKPEDPLEHQLVDYPEDHVKVCSVCGHYLFTDGREDWPGEAMMVCPGVPLTHNQYQSVHVSDPRRTPELREAQRLELLCYYMKKAGATEQELAHFNLAHERALGALKEADRERYDKERVGLA